jgi:hypothetical protein
MTNIWQDLRYGLRMLLNLHLGSECDTSITATSIPSPAQHSL